MVFKRIEDNITDKEGIFEKIKLRVPLNAYFTPVKWLNPIYVAHSKDELDVMLSSPLYFDVDMKDLNPPTYSEVQNNTLELINFINNEYDRTPDLILFSGRQGFHIHYWNWDFNNIIRLTPRDRFTEFVSTRKRLLKLILNKNIIIDENITADPYRIMKIPNTLHGKTGLVAKSLKSIDNFNPIKDAIVFSHEQYNDVFNLDWSRYE